MGINLKDTSNSCIYTTLTGIQSAMKGFDYIAGATDILWSLRNVRKE